MSVFYKFKSSLTYDTIQFDDLHITLQDFKKAVISQKQLGKNTNFDLQVTNAETNEAYNEQNSLIPKNSSLLVVRVPLTGTQKKWDVGDQFGSKIGVLSSDYLHENAGSIIVKSADLAALNASEEDKIKAMMFQSTVEYDPANFQKVKGGDQTGDPPPGYVCHKCKFPGHWIRNCPITVVPDVKKSSGIPQSFMTPVDPSAQGALMTPSGKFAVPIIDMQAYKEGKKEKPFIPSEETEESLRTIIPEDLTCSLCHDLMNDVVMMPCCGTSFCDECIRNHLIESDDSQCPDCKEKDVSPDTLIPNRFLRNKVNSFRNQSGYNDVRRHEVEPSKARAIDHHQDHDHDHDHDHDVEIVESLSAGPATATTTAAAAAAAAAVNDVAAAAAAAANETHARLSPKREMDVKETGSAIVVLGSRTSQPRAMPMNQQRNLVGNNLRLSPDDRENDRKKSSPGLGHVPPPTNKYTTLPPSVPNTSQLPPGYTHQQALQTIRPHFAGNAGVPGAVPPMHYGPPPGVNPMNLPGIPTSQPPGRMFPYGPPPGYQSHMRGGYRPHHMHPHLGDGYANRNNVVEDPEAAFESYLRERERQDRMKRSRVRRSRSRSVNRWKSLSRSRSRSPSKKRSSRSPHSPGMRKESPFARIASRSPPSGIRRSESVSRGRVRLRSRSPHSNSRSPPLIGMKKKRSRSISPLPVAYKKVARSPSPDVKKLRNRSPRSRSPVARPHKRRRSRSRSRTRSRSISRGRSFSGSPSPRRRPVFSPNYAQRRRRTPSPLRHGPPASRPRPSNHYRDQSPCHSSRHYESNDRYKRNARNTKYSRGSRYASSHNNYKSNSRYERPSSVERHDVKNGRDYGVHEDRSKARAAEHSASSPSNNYQQQYHQYTAYEEVAPPGTTDLPPGFGYPPELGYFESNQNHDERRGDDSTFNQTSSSRSNLRDTSAATRDDGKRSKEHHDREREATDHRGSRSRDRHHGHHHHHNEPEKNKAHGSQSHHSHAKESKKDALVHEAEKLQKADSEDKKEAREKRDRSKRKKKKESDVEKKRKDSEGERKKKKRTKPSRKDDSKSEKKTTTTTTTTTTDSTASDESKARDSHVQDDLRANTAERVDNVNALPPKNDHDDVSRAKNDGALIVVSVPELSKWERDELSNSTDESQRAIAAHSPDADKRLVTNEILRHAEKALFHKGATSAVVKSCRTVECKSETPSLKDELVVVETAREARKSGNSIQVTVPAAPAPAPAPTKTSAVEDSAESRPSGRISAKHRLGAKVDDKNYSTSTAAVRSQVEPKVKPRSTVNAVLETKRAKHHEKHDDSKRLKEKKSEKHSKHRDAKEVKDKLRKDLPAAQLVEEAIEPEPSVNDGEAKATFDKKQPVIDEAHFEPDYDLTESEGEIRDDEPPISKKTDSAQNALKEAKSSTEKPSAPKLVENAEDVSSSESASGSSTDSSNDRKKRKKRNKTKKKKKVKKRRAHSSSESETDESSDSESESDSKHKHKKKHKHRTRKSSKATKKKKKSKYK